MIQIKIEFQDENSTEFEVDATSKLTYRQLLVLVREMLETHRSYIVAPGAIINIQIDNDCCIVVSATASVGNWQIQLVADEFYLAAQHIFFAQRNQMAMQAAHNQQEIAALQHGGRGNSGLIISGGQR